MGILSDILNESILISKHQIIAEGAHIPVAIMITPEEEGHTEEVGFQTNITVDIMTKWMLRFLTEWMVIRALYSINFLSNSNSNSLSRRLTIWSTFQFLLNFDELFFETRVFIPEALQTFLPF